MKEYNVQVTVHDEYPCSFYVVAPNIRRAIDMGIAAAREEWPGVPDEESFECVYCECLHTISAIAED